jgi:hypothetical protein
VAEEGVEFGGLGGGVALESYVWLGGVFGVVTDYVVDGGFRDGGAAGMTNRIFASLLLELGVLGPKWVLWVPRCVV